MLTFVPMNSPTPTLTPICSLTKGFRDTISDGFDSVSDTFGNVGNTVGDTFVPQFSRDSLPLSRENAANLDKLLPGASGDSSEGSGQTGTSVFDNLDNPLQGLGERLIEPLIAKLVLGGSACVCVLLLFIPSFVRRLLCLSVPIAKQSVVCVDAKLLFCDN